MQVQLPQPVLLEPTAVAAVVSEEGMTVISAVVVVMVVVMAAAVVVVAMIVATVAVAVVTVVEVVVVVVATVAVVAVVAMVAGTVLTPMIKILSLRMRPLKRRQIISLVARTQASTSMRMKTFLWKYPEEMLLILLNHSRTLISVLPCSQMFVGANIQNLPQFRGIQFPLELVVGI